MRLPNTAHAAHPWRIAAIAPDFELLDAWALPVEGRRDDFAAFLEGMASLDPADSGSRVSRVLFSLRFRLGAWFGWDDPARKRPIPGCVETTLCARLPAELRNSARTRMTRRFVPLYQTDTEWAAEISNDTVHGVLHLAWVEQREGRYRAQMGIYVKPRGRFGALYMKLIQPFRHRIVYPALMRQIRRAWDARATYSRSDARAVREVAMIEKTIERWHRHLRGELPGGLDELLHDDVVFYSPVVFTPQRGKAIAKMYLQAAQATFPGDADGAGGGGGSFRYVKQILSGSQAALEFETRMDGKFVNGVDLITCNQDGKIIEFKVMIRPLQAVDAVHARMRSMLESMTGGAQAGKARPVSA